MARKKAKYEVGQVVAWAPYGLMALAYYEIASFFFDQNDELRYTFRQTDSVSTILCPVEECVRPLTAEEAGKARSK